MAAMAHLARKGNYYFSSGYSCYCYYYDYSYTSRLLDNLGCQKLHWWTRWIPRGQACELVGLFLDSSENTIK